MMDENTWNGYKAMMNEHTLRKVLGEVIWQCGIVFAKDVDIELDDEGVHHYKKGNLIDVDILLFAIKHSQDVDVKKYE